MTTSQVLLFPNWCQLNFYYWIFFRRSEAFGDESW